MSRFRGIDRLSWKLGISVSLLVVCALGAGFYLVYRAYWKHLLAETTEHALAETRLIREALEHQMLQNDRSLIRQMVAGFGSGANIERVMVLDRTGLVRFSSDNAIHSEQFSLTDRTCQACHRKQPQARSRTITLDIGGRPVLRCVQPIANKPACHRCHGSKQRMNGVLIADVPLAHFRGRLEQNVTRLALGTGAIGLLLLAGIGWLFRRMIMGRLLRFEDTARAIAAGDLARRVPLTGNDALSSVEAQFNRMADSVARLLGQVEDQRARLEKVINSVDDGMLVLEPDMRIAAVNRAFIARFPETPADLIGRRCCDLQAGHERPCYAHEVERLARACFESSRGQTAVRECMADDGSPRHDEIHVSPIMDADGRVTHCVEVWRDITDRRSAEARLADYQKLASLGMLAAGFSHEINTPLASIGLCLEGLSRLAGDQVFDSQARSDELARMIAIASEQVDRCGQITEQFLSLARGDRMSSEIVDLSRCARSIVRLVEPTARQAQVSVNLADDGQSSSVVANPAAIQQVLLNLTLNAIQASPAGSTVDVCVHGPDEPAIEIRDRGPGIPPGDLARIFEPFVSLREGGTGLGLFVSVGLARGWGGDILVDSRPGRGSVFKLVFPGRQKPEVEHG